MEQAQAFKDKYLVSDKCYVGIRRFISRNLPGIKKLRKQRDVLRTEMQIKRNSFGYFNIVQNKIACILERVFIDRLDESATLDEEVGDKKVFLLKFAGRISRNIKVFNFVFSCLNETQRCESDSGHYTLGVFQIEREEKEELKKVLAELAVEIKNLENIKMQKKNIELKNTWLVTSNFYTSPWASRLLTAIIHVHGAQSQMSSLKTQTFFLIFLCFQ